MNELTRVATAEPPVTGPDPEAGGREIAAADERQVVQAETPTTLLSAVVQMAKDPSVDVQKLQALLAMQERLEARQAEAEFNAALARLARIMPRVKKNGTVKLTRKDGTDGGFYPFAKWEDMDAVLRPLYTAEGFSLSFDAVMRQADGGGLVVTGRLSHDRGHSRTASLPLPTDAGAGRNNLQAIGSTLSYGKRYTAEMLLNIVREGVDDDGDAAGRSYIKPEQAEEIYALLRETKTQVGSFLDYMFGGEARSVEEIEVKDFTRAKNALLTKRQRLQQAASHERPA